MYTEEANKLESALNENHISYDIINVLFPNGGYVFRFADGSDVAIHDGTYGHEIGLWESYKMPQDNGDVTGWLSIEEVIERLKMNLKGEKL